MTNRGQRIHTLRRPLEIALAACMGVVLSAGVHGQEPAAAPAREHHVLEVEPVFASLEPRSPYQVGFDGHGTDLPAKTPRRSQREYDMLAGVSVDGQRVLNEVDDLPEAPSS